jgi:hypothetical protein
MNLNGLVLFIFSKLTIEEVRILLKIFYARSLCCIVSGEIKGRNKCPCLCSSCDNVNTMVESLNRFPWRGMVYSTTPPPAAPLTKL